MDLRHGAQHRRRHSRQPAARVARGTRAEIELGAWPVPKIFSYLAEIGKLDQEELLATFNLGAGMILIVPQSKCEPGGRPQTPPRKILPHRPRRHRRHGASHQVHWPLAALARSPQHIY